MAIMALMTVWSIVCGAGFVAMIVQLCILFENMVVVVTFLGNVLAQVTGVLLVIVSMSLHLVAFKVVLCDRFVIMRVDALCDTVTILMPVVMTHCRILRAKNDY